MPVTQNTAAPYAPTSAIISLIEKHRNKGFSSLDSDVLARAGVPDSLISRTLQALTTLDLVDDGGRPTDTLEGLRLAPESEFKARLADWLRAAYADALGFIEPDSSEPEIRDAFRKYTPVGQQARMVTLFVGLFAAAGLREAPERKTGTRSPAPRRPPPSSSGQSRTQNAQPSHNTRHDTQLNPAIAGLLQSLPTSDEGWTEEKRDKFLTTFGHVLNFCIPILSERDARKYKTSMEGNDET